MKEELDIFTKKVNVKKQKPKLDVDYREKNSLVPSELVSLGMDVEFKELKVADYIVNGIAIERKTVSDFISSMMNRRILNQLEELQQYESRLLIIEGISEQELYTDSGKKREFYYSLADTENYSGNLKEKGGKANGIPPNAVRSFLLTVLLKHKVPIIFTKNAEDTAKFISVLSKKKPKETPLNVRKKALNPKEQKQFIIESFPGIGPKKAKALLKRFGTLKGIINASEKELREIIGKKAENIKKIIEEKY